jgi:hypothetical protein
MSQEQRGLRFPFSTRAEVRLEGSRETIPARVVELSLRGCFLEIPSALKEQQSLRVKILHSGQSFEAAAEVLYVTPAGVGLLFGDIETQSREVLQSWILTALDQQANSAHP